MTNTTTAATVSRRPQRRLTASQKLQRRLWEVHVDVHDFFRLHRSAIKEALLAVLGGLGFALFLMSLPILAAAIM